MAKSASSKNFRRWSWKHIYDQKGRKRYTLRGGRYDVIILELVQCSREFDGTFPQQLSSTLCDAKLSHGCCVNLISPRWPQRTRCQTENPVGSWDIGTMLFWWQTEARWMLLLVSVYEHRKRALNGKPCCRLNSMLGEWLKFIRSKTMISDFSTRFPWLWHFHSSIFLRSLFLTFVGFVGLAKRQVPCLGFAREAAICRGRWPTLTWPNLPVLNAITELSNGLVQTELAWTSSSTWFRAAYRIIVVSIHI